MSNGLDPRTWFGRGDDEQPFADAVEVLAVPAELNALLAMLLGSGAAAPEAENDAQATAIETLSAKVDSGHGFVRGDDEWKEWLQPEVDALVATGYKTCPFCGMPDSPICVVSPALQRALANS